jgi:hypothetical protein
VTCVLFFAVPVTPSAGSVRQDGSVWRDRILGVIQNYQSVQDNATQLRMALRRDDLTKETHDNFISYVLGRQSRIHYISMLSYIILQILASVHQMLYLPVFINSMNIF